MKAKMEQFPAMNPNPVLNAAKDGTVLYSNKAGEPLLNEWGVRVGEKLPSSIGNLVQKVISRNSPEKMEVKVGNKIYLVVFSPLPEQECVNISGFDISDQKEQERKFRESTDLKILDVELAEIIDIQAIKSLMHDFYKLVPIPIGIGDLKGNCLVGIGWQDICTRFHRVHPEAYKHCIESDTKLTSSILPGEFKLYKCKNNMWDIATPIMMGSQQVGYIIAGQFFFEGESVDYELFRSQARKYGFNEEEYIAALENVPRLSREAVNTVMSFFLKLASMISQLSYSNIKLDKSLSEHDTLVNALLESEEKYRNIVETANEGIAIVNSEGMITFVNKKIADMLGYTVGEIIGKSMWDFISDESKAIVETILKNGWQSVNESYELKLICKDGSPLWTYVNSKSLFDKDGKLIGTISMLTDTTERKKAEEALNYIEIARKKEIHHRIKNNLQVISSLLDLQADKIKYKKNITKSEVLEAFRESQDRVISMALIHEELHKGGEIDTLNFSHYIEELADNLFLTYRLGNDGIDLDMGIGEDIFFDIDTSVPLGIIINELVSNSLKHAFIGRDNGEIRIRLHKEENVECEIECDKSTTFILSVSDNGIGIPEDLGTEDLDSLGLQLVATLVDQLDGELELKRNNGTEFTIKFTV